MLALPALHVHRSAARPFIAPDTEWKALPELRRTARYD
jgi:hypothetical protein